MICEERNEERTNVGENTRNIKSTRNETRQGKEMNKEAKEISETIP